MIGAGMGPRASLTEDLPGETHRTSPERLGGRLLGYTATHLPSFPENLDASSEGSVKPLQCGKAHLWQAVPEHGAGPPVPVGLDSP